MSCAIFHPCYIRSTYRASLHVLALILGFTLSPTASPAQEQVILSVTAGKCSLLVASNDPWHTIRLRVHPQSSDCHIEKEIMLSALKAAFSKTDLPRLEGNYSSLYIGRLIDHPWLSKHLAITAYKDPAWDKKRGKPVTPGINKYVSNILSGKDITIQIEEAFAGSGYRVISTTVEKVLVGTFVHVPRYEGEMAPGKIPYDAQVWFRLEKN